MARRPAARRAVVVPERKTRRTVLFFKVHGGIDPKGGLRNYDVSAALQQIGALTFTSGDRYLVESDDKVTCCWPESNRLCLATVRRGDLPRVEQDGALRPLRIPAKSGLAEETHFVFFSHGIVGVLFNFYGPRPTRLVAYVAAKCRAPLDTMRLEPLVRQDIAAQLDGLAGIRLFDLAVRRPAVEIIREHDQS